MDEKIKTETKQEILQREIKMRGVLKQQKVS